MGENSRISWTDHTWNPWIGCTEVSPGCDRCYARTLSERWYKVEWGHKKPRRRTAPGNWRQPLRWDRDAAAVGTRARVFCASMADWADAEVPDVWRADLWDLIRRTPHLDWLLLTKRPNLIRRYLPADWGEGYPNVWLMATVESGRQAWRIDHLIAVPAVVHGLSLEPLLGPLDLTPWLPGIDWCVVGGESGKGYRPMDEAWAISIRNQCIGYGAAFFYKQSAGPRPGMGDLLEGREYKEFPEPRIVAALT